MAVESTVFYKKALLLVSGSLLLLPAFMSSALADKQFACRVSATGGWDCSDQERSAQLPPRPNSAGSTVIASKPVTEKVSSDSEQPKKLLAANNKGRALTTRSEDYSHLDWVPREQLTQAQMAEVGLYCEGSYIEPARLGSKDKTPLDEAPTYLTANASRYNEEKQIASLAGGVILQQGRMHAEADEANLNRLTNVGELSGNVRFRDNGALIVGDRAEIELNTGEAQIDNAEFVVHQSHYRGNARYVKRSEDGLIRLKDGTFTRCEPSDNMWTVTGNNVVLNRETGRGTATNATLRVKNIPIMYSPYVTFPIDKRRQSGLLVPGVSVGGDNGFTLTTPYYFNLAPNYDATLYPQLMTKRGLLMETEFRYLTPNSEGWLAAAYLNDNGNDDKDRKIYGEDTRQRWMYSWNNTTGRDTRWLAEVDYTRISDAFYFDDFSPNSNVESGVYVNQKGKLTYRGDDFAAAINLHAYQMATVTDVTGYNRLPQITLNGKLPFQPMGLNFAYDTEFARFDRDLENNKLYYDREGKLVGNHSDMNIRGMLRANGDRTHIEPSVSLPLRNSWGYVTPSIQYMYTKYDLDLDRRGKNTLGGRKFRNNQDREAIAYKVDSGLSFDRNANWFGSSRQTIEPRLMYLYVPYEKQDDLPVFDTKEEPFGYDSLFMTNRFSGRDRIGDTNQVALGVTSRLLEKDGFERQRASIGQAYYFKDRKVQMPGIDWRDRRFATNDTSPLAMQYMYRLDRDWRVSADYNWNTESNKTESGSVMLHYQPESNLNKIFNIGLRYRDDNVVYNQRASAWQVSGDMTTFYDRKIKDYYKIKQADTSFVWPIIPRWNLIGRWQYDYNRSRTLDSFGGFEYDSCCWKLRLVGRYWQKYDEGFYSDLNSKADRGIFLQVVFKGLGNIYGNKVDSFMDKGIEGYRKREDNDF